MSIDQKLIISGIVRNNSQYLNDIFANISSISTLFSEVKCIFVESDSSDNSLDMLQKFSTEQKNTSVISMGNLIDKYPLRTQRTAMCRNVYLDEVEKIKNEYPLLLVMDMDDVNSYPIQEESIISNFQYTDWDMITANNPDGYYDIWALRHPSWMPYDCWKAVFRDRPSFMSKEDAMNIHVESRKIKIDVNHPLIPVESAFSGMAFIKTDKIKGARHIGLDQEGYEIVEWIHFCKTLNEGNAKIYINPRFITNTNRIL